MSVVIVLRFLWVGVADSLRSARTAARYKQLLSGENREAIFRFVSRLLFAGPER